MVEHSIQQFYDLILNPKDIIKSCYFLIDRKKIKCSKPVYGVHIDWNKYLFMTLDLFGDLNDTQKSELIDLKNGKLIEKIAIKLDSNNYYGLEIHINQFDAHHPSPSASLL